MERMAYVDEGTGNNTILIIHGIGNYIKFYTPQITFLKASNRVIAVDLPGYGKTGFRDFSYNIDYHVESVISLIMGLKLNNVILTGHSYGAMVALDVFLKSPKNVIKKLILLGPAGLREAKEDEINTILGFVNENEKINDNTVKRSFARQVENNTQLVEAYLDEVIALTNSGEYKKTFITRTRVLRSVVPLLKTFHNKFNYIRIPILVIVGNQDRIVPISVIRQQERQTVEQYFKSLESLNPYSTVKIIEKCGHLLTIEQPDEVNKMINEFIKS